MWNYPENISGFVGLGNYIITIFPAFAYLSLTAFFFIFLLIFKESSTTPSSVTTSLFLTFLFSLFFVAMGWLPGIWTIFLGIATGFSLLYQHYISANPLG